MNVRAMFVEGVVSMKISVTKYKFGPVFFILLVGFQMPSNPRDPKHFMTCLGFIPL